jgi:hypothetical protein
VFDSAGSQNTHRAHGPEEGAEERRSGSAPTRLDGVAAPMEEGVGWASSIGPEEEGLLSVEGRGERERGGSARGGEGI